MSGHTNLVKNLFAHAILMVSISPAIGLKQNVPGQTKMSGHPDLVMNLFAHAILMASMTRQRLI